MRTNAHLPAGHAMKEEIIDTQHVHLDDPYEIRYWTERFQATPEDGRPPLRAAGREPPRAAGARPLTGPCPRPHQLAYFAAMYIAGNCFCSASSLGRSL